MNKKLTKTIILMLVVLTSRFVNAQSGDTLYIQKNEKGKIRFARFRVNIASDRKMQSDTLFLKSILHAKNEDNFREIEEYTDNLGITHKKFQQYYKGLKVENAQYFVHGSDGNIEVMNGDFQDIHIPSTRPLKNEQDALFQALCFNFLKT